MTASRRPARLRCAAVATAVGCIALACSVSGPSHAYGGPAQGCLGATSQAASLSTAQIEASLLCGINQERLAHGLRTVHVNAVLRASAIAHTRLMVADGFFSHNCLNGDTFIDRIRASGYLRRTRSWLVGENLAWGSGLFSTPASLIEAWMASPSHRENLLRRRFLEVGIVAVRGTPHSALDPNGVTVSSEFGYIVRKKCRKRRS